MLDLSNERVFVGLFVMPGCGACHEFLPRFERMIARYPGMPYLVYDAASPDPGLVAFMDQYAVNVTPTLLILQRGPGSIRLDGALDDATLKRYLDDAWAAHQGR